MGIEISISPDFCAAGHVAEIRRLKKELAEVRQEAAKRRTEQRALDQGFNLSQESNARLRQKNEALHAELHEDREAVHPASNEIVAAVTYGDASIVDHLRTIVGDNDHDRQLVDAVDVLLEQAAGGRADQVATIYDRRQRQALAAHRRFVKTVREITRNGEGMQTPKAEGGSGEGDECVISPHDLREALRELARATKR